MILVLLTFIYASAIGFIVPDNYVHMQQHAMWYPLVRQPGARYPIIQHPVMQYPPAQYPGPQYPCFIVNCVGYQGPFNGRYIQQHPVSFNIPTVKQIPAEEPTTITATSSMTTTLQPLYSTGTPNLYLPTSTNTEEPTTSGVLPAYSISSNIPTVKQIPAEEPTTITATSSMTTTLQPLHSTGTPTLNLPTSTTTEEPTTSRVSSAYSVSSNIPTVKQIPAEEPTTITATSSTTTTLQPLHSTGTPTLNLPTSTTTEEPTTSGVSPAYSVSSNIPTVKQIPAEEPTTITATSSMTTTLQPLYSTGTPNLNLLTSTTTEEPSTSGVSPAYSVSSNIPTVKQIPAEGPTTITATSSMTTTLQPLHSTGTPNLNLPTSTTTEEPTTSGVPAE